LLDMPTKRNISFPHLWKLVFSPDSKLLAQAGGHGPHIVRLWDMETREILGALMGHTSSIQALAYSSDGRILASGDTMGIIKLWNLTSMTEQISFSAGERDIAALAFSPDNVVLAIAAGMAVQLIDNPLAILGPGQLPIVRRLGMHQKKVNCVVFSQDGK